MAEKLTRKEKIAQQKQSPRGSSKLIEEQKNQKRTLIRMLGLLAAIAGFILYANTIGHDYVLDDFGLIKDNVQTKKGISAVPEIFKSSYRYGMNMTDYQLYRPLSKAMFAIEWSISPDNPLLGHVINIFLFALTCYLLVIVLNRYMNDALLVPFLTALIFASHPLHTEVVANIKSRDEIVCFLLCISAVGSLHSYVTKNSMVALIAGIACYFLALFTKESAITFLAIIPLFYYFFTSAKKAKYIQTLVTMGICTIVFLLIRKSVLGNVETLIPAEDNSLVAIKNFFVQRGNAIYILGIYLKLLIFPLPLVSDGSYNTFPEIALTSWKILVPFAILSAAFVLAISRFKKKDPISFAILYFYITVSIVSNVIILIGTNYGERLMFIPSLGFCMLVAFLLPRLFRNEIADNAISNAKSFFKSHNKSIALAALVVLPFGYQTMARNLAWKDNYTLYTTDLENLPNSAHMHFYFANHISTEEYLKALPDSMSRNNSRNQAIEHLTKAVTIFPKYADGYQRRGFIYNQFKQTEKAERDYKLALQCNPTHPIVYNNYGTLCFDAGRYDDAFKNFEQAIRYNPRYAHALNNMASINGVFGLNEQRLISADPVNKNQHSIKAKEYFETAVTYFLKAIEADSDFGEPYRLLAVTYRSLGEVGKAEKYERLHKEVMARYNAKN